MGAVHAERNWKFHGQGKIEKTGELLEEPEPQEKKRKRARPAKLAEGEGRKKGAEPGRRTAEKRGDEPKRAKRARAAGEAADGVRPRKAVRRSALPAATPQKEATAEEERPDQQLDAAPETIAGELGSCHQLFCAQGRAPHMSGTWCKGDILCDCLPGTGQDGVAAAQPPQEQHQHRERVHSRVLEQQQQHSSQQPQPLQATTTAATAGGSSKAAAVLEGLTTGAPQPTALISQQPQQLPALQMRTVVEASKPGQLAAAGGSPVSPRATPPPARRNAGGSLSCVCNCLLSFPQLAASLLSSVQPHALKYALNAQSERTVKPHVLGHEATLAGPSHSNVDHRSCRQR
jgi:hypothetical protein